MAEAAGTTEDAGPNVVLDVLSGKSRALSLSTALGLLPTVAAEPGERERTIAPLLGSALDPRVRRATAVTLGRLGSDDARQHLRGALAVEGEGRVLAAVGTALGLAGDEQDVPALLSAAAHTEDPLAERRLRFAAGLIAHRLGLAEPEIDLPPPTRRLSEPGGETVRVSARAATDDERTLVVEGLDREPVGLPGPPGPVHVIECGRQPLFVALTPGIAGDLGRVNERKTLLGALLILSVEHNTTSPSSLVLSAPRNDGCEILVTRVSGELLYRGPGQFDGAGSTPASSVPTPSGWRPSIYA
jgi:hypothetical protein